MAFPRVYNQATYPASFGALSLTSFVRGGGPDGSTYNDSPYVHALNRALQLEHAAVAIYVAKQRSAFQVKRSGASAMNRSECHHTALRQLVKLIFAQRGVPDSDPAGLTAVTGTVAARVSRYMPPMVQDPVLGVSAQRIELALARRYRQLLEIAPTADRVLIRDLLEQVSQFSQDM